MTPSTRPLRAYFNTHMSVIRPIEVLSKDELGPCKTGRFLTWRALMSEHRLPTPCEPKNTWEKIFSWDRQGIFWGFCSCVFLPQKERPPKNTQKQMLDAHPITGRSPNLFMLCVFVFFWSLDVVPWRVCFKENSLANDLDFQAWNHTSYPSIAMLAADLPI